MAWIRFRIHGCLPWLLGLGFVGGSRTLEPRAISPLVARHLRRGSSEGGISRGDPAEGRTAVPHTEWERKSDGYRPYVRRSHHVQAPGLPRRERMAHHRVKGDRK